MSEKYPMTPAGHATMKAHLNKLKNVDRIANSRAIEVARGHGDLSENADYSAAKEEQGLIEAEWRPTENNRNAKFYALTRKGRRAAQAELDGWLRLSGAVARVLRALEQEA